MVTQCVYPSLGFMGRKKAAQKYSISSSSLEGGNIGWINSKSLSDEFLAVLKKINIGDKNYLLKNLQSSFWSEGRVINFH